MNHLLDGVFSLLLHLCKADDYDHDILCVYTALDLLTTDKHAALIGVSWLLGCTDLRPAFTTQSSLQCCKNELLALCDSHTPTVDKEKSEVSHIFCHLNFPLQFKPLFWRGGGLQTTTLCVKILI